MLDVSASQRTLPHPTPPSSTTPSTKHLRLPFEHIVHRKLNMRGFGHLMANLRYGTERIGNVRDRPNAALGYISVEIKFTDDIGCW